MPTQFAVDFGTTNTVVAFVDAGNVRILTVPEIGRQLPIEQSDLIPTAVHVQETVRRRFLFQQRIRQVRIGQQALNQNFGGMASAGSFVRSFKPLLADRSHAPVPPSNLSAREVSHLFLQELLSTLRRQNHRPTHLTIPTPVGYYETFRAELKDIAQHLRIKHFQTIDEPVAAAVGYGVNVARDENLLVVDFGGGTLDLAVVRLGPSAAQGQAAAVLAKHMVALGGNDVDRWILDHFAPSASGLPGWEYEALWEVMRVKEQVSREGDGEFHWTGIRRNLDRAGLVDLLREHGLYAKLQTALEDITNQLDGVGSVDEVLLVGGSTLLPEVPGVVDAFFPKAIVRHDPTFVFTAVASGAARFTGGLRLDDHVYHDYALAVRNHRTHQVEYERLVPRHTRYPTATDFAVRHYADYTGMAEMSFEVYEVGRLGQVPVPWRMEANGNQYWSPLNETERGCLMQLNVADPPLPLRPAGKGTSPRLRVTYSVNQSRWLCQTVEDLVSRTILRESQPVIRLR